MTRQIIPFGDLPRFCDAVAASGGIFYAMEVDKREGCYVAECSAPVAGFVTVIVEPRCRRGQMEMELQT